MHHVITTTLFLLTLALPISAHAQSTASPTGPSIEVAFVLDTTGSMGDLIEGAKQKIWSIASKIATAKPAPTLRVGLVGYRDRGDAYVVKSFDLTEDLDSIYGHLLAFKADGGGDTPEHVGRALGEAVESFDWSASSKTMKTIFLVGDAPPQHYNDGWNHVDWAKKAIAKGIVVNTIQCGRIAGTGAAFQRIADLADGSFTAIDASGGMVAIHTPFDGKIEALNREMASTALYGGSGRAEAQRKAHEVGRMKGEAAANRVKYSFSDAGGKGAVLSSASAGSAQDLVAEPSALEEMAEAELPARLQGLAPASRKAHVAKLAKKRQALSAKLQRLSAKRDAYVAKKVAKKVDSFDAQVMKQVKRQAARFGLSF